MSRASDLKRNAGDKTTEQIIHEAGLGGVVVALASHNKMEELAQLVAHLQHYKTLMEDAAIEQELAALPAGMTEPDLRMPRPAAELAAILGITRQTLYDSASRPNGGRRQIQRVSTVVPGSNARYLYYLDKPDKALQMRAQHSEQGE